MYNADLKERFIETQTRINYRLACVAFFNAIEEYENKWNADICTKSTEEIQPIINRLVGMRSDSKGLRTSILKKYVSWCIDNNIAGACDGALHVTTTSTLKLESQTVRNPAHLQMYLNQICDPEEEETCDNMIRCFVWMAYAGLAEEDIFHVRSGDVDFSNMTIKYEGCEYPIYRESIPAFRNCVNSPRFAIKNLFNSVYRDRVPGDILVRGVKADPDIYTFRNALSKNNREAIRAGRTNIRLSYYRAWLSGLFYRTYLMESAGISPNFTEAAEEMMKDISYSLNRTKSTLGSIRNTKAKLLLIDYENWKSTLIK